MRHALATVLALGMFSFACDSKVAREAALVDAQGLAVGAPVTAHGVTIGQVVEVTLGSGSAPVRVRFETEGSTTLPSDACARVGEGSLVVEPGPPAAGSFPDLPPCSLDLGNLLEDLTLPSMPDLPSIGEAAERAGAATREGVEGFVRGAAGDDSVRDVGRALGETLRELEQGVREGSEPAPSPTP